MIKKENNYAFIDSQNINLGVQELGWKVDWRRFRVYLRDKFKISKAYLFIGYKVGNESLYSFLQDAGYLCVFKPTLDLPNGKIKGNVDAELVLHTMIQLDNFESALIVSGDGDFFCLVEYLIKENKLLRVLVPNKDRYSSLLDRLSSADNKIIDAMNYLRDKVEYLKIRENEKGSRGTKPFENPFRRDDESLANKGKEVNPVRKSQITTFTKGEFHRVKKHIQNKKAPDGDKTP